MRRSFLALYIDNLPKHATCFYFLKETMPLTKANALGKAGTKRRSTRRRTSTSTKVRFQAPTARNQRRQIGANARDVAYLKKMVKDSRIWCDFQYKGDSYAVIDPAGNFTTSWSVVPLMRTDNIVERISSTYVSRMQLNLRYALQQSDYAQISLFIVTLRQQSASYNPEAVAPIANQDYILNNGDFNVRLNPSVWKCHYSRQVTMMANTYLEPSVPGTTAGDPKTTFNKGQINLKPKIKARAPFQGGLQSAWKNLDISQLPFYQRYYLIIHFNQRSAAGQGLQTGARVAWDLLATTINSD